MSLTSGFPFNLGRRLSNGGEILFLPEGAVGKESVTSGIVRPLGA